MTRTHLHTRPLGLITVAALALAFTGATHASTFNFVGGLSNNDIRDVGNYSGGAALGSPDTNTWEIGAGQTGKWDPTQTGDGTIGLAPTWAAGTTYVNGGTLQSAGNGATFLLDGNLTLNNASISGSKDRSLDVGGTLSFNGVNTYTGGGGDFSNKDDFIADTVNGSGTINIRNTNATMRFNIASQSGGAINMAGFTGTLNAAYSSGNQNLAPTISFDHDATMGAGSTFELFRTEFIGDGDISHAKFGFNNGVDVVVTHLDFFNDDRDNTTITATLGDLGLTTALAPGTYTYDQIVAVDAGYANFFGKPNGDPDTGGTGTITFSATNLGAGAPIPAPAALPGGLALMGVMLFARRRT